MPGTVIYLHGALDSGYGYVSKACQGLEGSLYRACAARGFTLRNPIADGNLFPVSWHTGTLLARVEQTLQENQGPFYLAGHSLGGRGALLIGLRGALGERFQAVGAIAPALGKGLDGVPLAQPDAMPALAAALSPLGKGFFAERFSSADARQALAQSQKPVFIAYTPLDVAVNLREQDFSGVHNPAIHRVVKNYGITRPPLDPHNALIADSAEDLIGFFAALP